MKCFLAQQGGAGTEMLSGAAGEEGEEVPSGSGEAGPGTHVLQITGWY